MTPKKTKSGKYHVTAYVGKINGKPVYKSITAPTKRECILKATEYINHAPKSPEDMTVKDAIEKYIESKEKVLSPSTIRGYQQIYGYYYPPIYDIPISDFGNYEFQTFISSLEVSPKSVRNIYGLLRSALGMFSERSYKITLPEKTTQRRTVATEGDIKLLLENADPEMRKAIILGSCSLRRGEVAALKYSDIEDNTLYVHADIVKDSAGNYVYKDSAKTPASTRRVEVSNAVIEALGDGEGYIVRLRNPDAITKRFTRLRDSLGLDVSFHSLRRFYASICHALGVPNAYVMKSGGWKSESVMINSYRHTLSDKEKEYSDKVNSAINTIIIQ